jgi:hypothetical protein
LLVCSFFTKQKPAKKIIVSLSCWSLELMCDLHAENKLVGYGQLEWNSFIVAVSFVEDLSAVNVSERYVIVNAVLCA